MTGDDGPVANDPHLSPLSLKPGGVRIWPGGARPISISLLSTRNSPLRDTTRASRAAASDDACSVGRIARRGAVASIRFRRRGRPLKGVGAGARIGLQKQKYGRRRQAEPRIAAYHPKPKDG